jgi:hypothetical protein
MPYPLTIDQPPSEKYQTPRGTIDTLGAVWSESRAHRIQLALLYVLQVSEIMGVRIGLLATDWESAGRRMWL